MKNKLIYALMMLLALGTVQAVENVTGWNYLMNGQVGMAAFTALDEPIGGWLVTVFWIIITMIIITRTNSWELATIIGLLFLSAFFAFPWFGTAQKGSAIIFITFLVSMTLFRMIAKEKNI